MKNFIILAGAIFALNSFAETIECAKDASKISFTKKEVIIESASVPLNDQLRQVAFTMAGADASANITIGVKISIPKKDLKCTDSIAKVISCQGKTKKASVTLNVSQQTQFGSSSMESMRQPVKIENIEINTSVGSSGPVVLGSDSTTVELNELTAKSSMLVRMNGDFQLDLEQKFETSLCE
ncbi:MAG: hypothetical protein ACJ76H_09840 [Bacteriovoracaceae bacterium]